jgi:hypothetical protein
MLRAFLFVLASLWFVPLAQAQARSCAGPGETDCMFEAIWTAAEALPAEKQARIKPLFLETVARAADKGLIQRWEARLGTPARLPSAPVDYTMSQAKAVVAEHGWTGFEQLARSGAAPFNIGRPEIMAAGVRLAGDEATKRRLTNAMFDLAHTKTTRGGMGDDFEKGDFGHALAELSMQRCDLAGFDRAVALTAVPDSLRYAMWRGRITGRSGLLAGRIIAEADGDDTRHVRNALEGYAPVVALGPCGR